MTSVIFSCSFPNVASDVPSGVRPGGQEEQGVYGRTHETKGRNTEFMAGHATDHSSPWCKVPKSPKYMSEGGSGSCVKSNPELFLQGGENASCHTAELT